MFACNLNYGRVCQPSRTRKLGCKYDHRYPRGEKEIARSPNPYTSTLPIRRSPLSKRLLSQTAQYRNGRGSISVIDHPNLRLLSDFERFGNTRMAGFFFISRLAGRNPYSSGWDRPTRKAPGQQIRTLTDEQIAGEYEHRHSGM